ncbi:hypothetical protein TNCV_3215461 [Trichonephila clavipes]|nr:hypothetical protein TNCV_3215461 [Trichonephila clavipes]
MVKYVTTDDCRVSLTDQMALDSRKTIYHSSSSKCGGSKKFRCVRLVRDLQELWPRKPSVHLAEHIA